MDEHQTTANIRKSMKHRRAALSQTELNQAAMNLAKHARPYASFLYGKRIATYLPCNGEVSPNILQSKTLTKANLFLPYINDFKRSTMQFFSYQNRLRKNKFNIHEPVPSGRPIRTSELDIVLVPLLAFDRQGNRIGMGGGFYDRAFAFCKAPSSINRPLLVGLAHHFQEQEQLKPEKWDIPLDTVLTDQELIKIT